MKKFILPLLLILCSCGDIRDEIENLVTDNSNDPVIESSPIPEPSIKPTPKPLVNPSIKPTPVISEGKEVSENNLYNTLKPECFKPLSTSGFKCIASDTRNGDIVCVLPYYYTVKPRYSKVDHHGNTVLCNKHFVRFDKVTVEYDSKTVDLFYEDKNQYTGEIDYSCANYVGSPEGPVGRQHWRGKNIKFDTINKSANIKLKLYKKDRVGCLIVK